MKTCISLIFTFFVIAPTAYAETLGMEQFLQYRIGRTKPIPVEDLELVFKDSPTLRYECALDTTLTSTPDEESAQLLTDYVPVAPTGEIAFHFKKLNYGFDISIQKSMDNIPKALPPDEINTINKPSSSLECATGEDYTCKNLKVDYAGTYDIKLGENFAPGMDISENFQFYIYSHENIYMKYSIDFQVKMTGMWGQSTGTANYTKSYVCALFRSDKI